MFSGKRTYLNDHHTATDWQSNTKSYLILELSISADDESALNLKIMNLTVRVSAPYRSNHPLSPRHTAQPQIHIIALIRVAHILVASHDVNCSGLFTQDMKIMISLTPVKQWFYHVRILRDLPSPSGGFRANCQRKLGTKDGFPSNFERTMLYKLVRQYGCILLRHSKIRVYLFKSCQSEIHSTASI